MSLIWPDCNHTCLSEVEMMLRVGETLTGSTVDWYVQKYKVGCVNVAEALMMSEKCSRQFVKHF